MAARKKARKPARTTARKTSRKKTVRKPAKKTRTPSRARPPVRKKVVRKRANTKRVVKRVTRKPVKRVKRRVLTKKKRAAKTRIAKKPVRKKAIRKAAKKNVVRKRVQKKTTNKRRTTRSPKRASKAALRALLARVRNSLRPPTQAPPVVLRVTAELEKKLPGTSIVAGGSFAKGTMLRGNHDVDLFVRFPLGTPDAHMSEALQKALPNADVMHGSRDYLQFTRGGVVFEVVPVLHITAASELVNVTDMSPLHVAYVHGHLTSEQKDDVRLAKRFAKAAGVYGAESHVRGFSGYVLELLIAQYGSFEQFLAALVRWPGQLVLDPAHHYADEHEARAHLNESKLGPLVLVDPLDPARNASAAVSAESITKLRTHAAAFLEKPHKDFFDPTVRIAKIRASWPGQHVVFARVQTPKGRQDIVGSQVLAVHTKAVQSLRDSEFPLLHASWRFGAKESICWYVLGALRLPARREQQGPPSDISHAVVSFRTAHPGAYERNGRWYAHTKRAHVTAQDAIRAGFGSWKVKLEPAKAPAARAPKRSTRAQNKTK